MYFTDSNPSLLKSLTGKVLLRCGTKMKFFTTNRVLVGREYHKAVHLNLEFVFHYLKKTRLFVSKSYHKRKHSRKLHRYYRMAKMSCWHKVLSKMKTSIYFQGY